jgi:hypothetical protein
MADHEFDELEDQDHTAEMPMTAVSGAETESILVVLTSVFLLLATAMVLFLLHSVYGLGKDKGTLDKEIRAIESTAKSATMR